MSYKYWHCLYNFLKVCVLTDGLLGGWVGREECDVD